MILDSFQRIPNLLNLLGIAPLFNTFLGVLVGWVGAGTRPLLGAFGHVLNSATQVSFGAGFLAEFAFLRNFGFEIIGGFVCLVVIEAIIRQDLGLLGRTFLLRLPAALLLSGLGIEVVSALVRVSDVVSAGLLRGDSGAFDRLVLGLSTLFGGTRINIPVLSGFGGLLFAFVLAIAVLCCLVELVVRSAAISIAALFIPLALAGLVFRATQHWIRRLCETLFALIMSKVVIAAVFSLAISSLGSPRGLSMVLEGIALFVLCIWAPFTVMHLLPFFESGASSHLESLAHRGGQVVRHATRAVAPIIGDHFFPPEQAGVRQTDGIAWMSGESSARIEVDPEDEEALRFLAPFVTVREPNADGSRMRRPPTISTGEGSGGESSDGEDSDESRSR